MFETDPITMVTFTQEAVQIVAQAGPPSDLPAAVPDFVSELLTEISAAAGDAKSGLGETIKDIVPGGSEVSDGADNSGK